MRQRHAPNNRALANLPVSKYIKKKKQDLRSSVTVLSYTIFPTRRKFRQCASDRGITLQEEHTGESELAKIQLEGTNCPSDSAYIVFRGSGKWIYSRTFGPSARECERARVRRRRFSAMEHYLFHLAVALERTLRLGYFLQRYPLYSSVEISSQHI